MTSEERDFELHFARDSRTLFCIAASLCAVATLGLAVFSIYPAAAALVAGTYLARQAVLSQKRIDSLHARALAADLAEGADSPVFAEAA